MLCALCIHTMMAGCTGDCSKARDRIMELERDNANLRAEVEVLQRMRHTFNRLLGTDVP